MFLKIWPVLTYFLSCQEIGNKPLPCFFYSISNLLPRLWLMVHFTRRQAAVQRWLMLSVSKKGICALYIVLLHPSNVSLSMHTESSNRLCLPDLWKVVRCTLQGAQSCTKKTSFAQCTFEERDNARLLWDLSVADGALIKRRHKSNCIMRDSTSHSCEGADVTCR